MTSSLESVNLQKISAQLGEFAWHSNTIDPNIEKDSLAHYEELKSNFKKYAHTPKRVLEVACYAHITGYWIAEEYEADVTLFDLSPHTLNLGKQSWAERAHMKTPPKLVAGDFHHLPFDSNSYDTVIIYSALHHTYDFKTVARELQRVLSKDGILFLMNEPCFRESSFYKFSTNRPHDFTPFEKSLDSLGLIKIVAEPFPGSRPELLFGMIENQTMPLYELLHVFQEESQIISSDFDTSSSIGELEQLWISNADRILLESQDSLKELTEFIIDTLCSRVDEAKKCFTPLDRALNFSYPDNSELTKKAHSIAKKLLEIVTLERKNPNSELLEIQKATLFGAAIKLIIKKNKSSLAREWKRNNEKKIDEVRVAFPSSMMSLLGQDQSLLPDVQNSTDENLYECFPEEQWDIQTVNGINVISTAHTASIKLNAQGKHLILLRSYLTGPITFDKSYFLTFEHNGKEIYKKHIVRNDSLLIPLVLNLTGRDTLLINFKTKNGEKLPVDFTAGFNFSYSGLYSIEKLNYQ